MSFKQEEPAEADGLNYITKYPNYIRLIIRGGPEFVAIDDWVTHYDLTSEFPPDILTVNYTETGCLCF
jgi:hypothetical protein